ncbi:rhomboid family intramembrane serine protease [Peribacillus frigoritolerans]|nr:rhomboid family intramembrane serine protease [Peribacillus frigoritolerans]
MDNGGVLITPIFLHSTFTHLLFNGFSLAIFGPFLEKLLGAFKFSIFFLSTGILANIATFLINPLTYNHVGASGAIFWFTRILSISCTVQ